MSVFRVEKSREFTVIANSVFKDKTLSAKAKGILVEMLSLPENWDYTLKGLTYLFSDGIDSIRQGIRELEEHGYIVRERKRDAKGRLGGMEYVIYETPRIPVNYSEESTTEPVSEKPVCACPAEELPTTEIPTQAVPAEETAMTYKEINNKELKESSTYESNQSISEPSPMALPSPASKAVVLCWWPFSPSPRTAS